jgi:hypothetical protein
MILTDEEIDSAYELAANQHLRPQDKRMVFAVSRTIEAAVLAKLANNQQAWTDKVMAQVQVFASAWSLVGGRFDDGTMLDQSKLAKEQLREMLASKVVKP